MHSLVKLHGESICKHFQSRADYLDMLMDFNTTAEEWFRIELLGVMRSMQGVTVRGTNHRGLTGAARPDFSLDVAEKRLQIELKVLPKDRNYGSGWQRFQAGSNNKKDFQSLVGGGRSGVIYVYWPDIHDWEICAAKIREVFAVHCLREDRISCNGETVIFSYWVSAQLHQLHDLTESWRRLGIVRQFVKVHHFSSPSFATKASSLNAFVKWCSDRDIRDENYQTLLRGLEVARRVDQGVDIASAITQSWERFPLVSR